MADNTCPIWRTPATSRTTDRAGEEVDSIRAGGRYFISNRASRLLANWNVHDKVLLTTWLVEQRRLGVSCPEILDTTLDEVKKRRPLSVFDRADALLHYLDDKNDLLGTITTLSGENSKTVHELLAWTASQQSSEVVALGKYCTEQGWIDFDIRSTSGVLHDLDLKPRGYARLAELEGINPESSQAFVAMWFGSDSSEDVYQKGINLAVEEAGYQAVRIDKIEHNNKIDDEIIAAIRRSRFLIADFTQGDEGARGGVYYEAGFAYGLNIPVIFTCHEDGIEKVHFDTRQYNHIIWTDPDDLRERLVQRISATIGDGPLKESL